MTDPASSAPRKRLVYICDWLPPDFGAVGQYSDLFAREMARSGMDVVLGGLSSKQASVNEEHFERGSLKIVRLSARPYGKDRFVERLWWTFRTNTRLVFGLWSSLRTADEILFTGSPPLFLHWIVPLNLILGKTLVYRITDFHPECLMAARDKPSLLLSALYRLTLFWRRRVHVFEILGEDQRRRLEEIGIPADRIRLKRDPSPVEITADTRPLARPAGYDDKVLLLYSGNWGVAHDYDTFVAAYRRHHREGSGRVVLWLNAVGSAAGKVEAALKADGLPFIRSNPVPIEDLAALLVTPDAHLISLLDGFVGFVLPSKVYGCVASGRPVLFIGSDRSDVHALSAAALGARYQRVDVGAVEEALAALERLGTAVQSTRAAEAAEQHGLSHGAAAR